MRTPLVVACFLAVAPVAVLAQEVPGLDLSQPPKPAEPARSEPGEELPPIDLSNPPPGKAAPAETKPEPQPQRPFSDKDVALGDKVKAVQRKGFIKRGRIELTPMFAGSVNDAYYQKFGFGLKAAYNLQDSFAVALRGILFKRPEAFPGWFPDWSAYRTDNVREGKLAFSSQVLASQIEQQVMLDGIWSPVYGKAAFREKSIVHFDLFLTAGFGAVWSSTSARDGAHIATDLGGGLRFYPKEWLAFELGLIATLYPDQPFLSLPATIQKVFVANAGVSFFFPTTFDYVYP